MSRAESQRPRGQRLYAKPALTHEEQLARLIDRGLDVADADRALRYLRHLGYYRLSPYMLPFQALDGSHAFDPGTSFDDALTLYVFDRKLRLLVLDALERVEVAIRAALTDAMSEAHGPHWYTDSSLFKNGAKHAGLVSDLRRTSAAQLQRRAESDHSRLNYPSALEHYLTAYGEPELPPSWIMIEGLTLGGLDHLYRNIHESHPKHSVAVTLGINETLLDSWLRTYVRIRNICAHHGRLWNVGLGVYPKLVASRTIPWPRQAGAVPIHYRHRLYPALASLQCILVTVSPGSSWRLRLADLLREYPSAPLAAMGFPNDWERDPFWRP